MNEAPVFTENSLINVNDPLEQQGFFVRVDTSENSTLFTIRIVRIQKVIVSLTHWVCFRTSTFLFSIFRLIPQVHLWWIHLPGE